MENIIIPESISPQAIKQHMYTFLKPDKLISQDFDAHHYNGTISSPSTRRGGRVSKARWCTHFPLQHTKGKIMLVAAHFHDSSIHLRALPRR